MRQTNFLRTLFASLLILNSLLALAQHLPCGNGPFNLPALENALRFEKNANRVQTVNYLVRVYFHVLRNDDGTNAAATTAQINSEFTTLVGSYTTDNLCFLNSGIEFINNTNINQNFNADNDPNGTAFSTIRTNQCIDIFYLQKINGNNTACSPPCGYGGIALGGIPGTFCLIATGNIGAGNTISHEVGHCLGLYHTFDHSFGYEDINGANASTTGDKITDTPADPWAYSGNSCFTKSANGCSYTGNCKDPNHDSIFSPSYSNLMAYWWGGSSGICVPNPTATAGQFTRVNSFLNTFTPLINCSSPLNLTLNTIDKTSGYYMNSAINTLNTIGNVILEQTTIATLGGGTVLLEPGFRATPTGSGLTHIITKPCN